MAKNQSTFSIKGQLDISNITKGLDQIKSKIQSSDIGTGLTAGLMKDLNAIQKKFETAFKNLPGVGATSTQVEKFATKIYDATEELNLLAQKMKDFGATDKYIKENIGSIQKFAKKATEASYQLANLKNQVNEKAQFKDSTILAEKAQLKTIHKSSTAKMRGAAQRGETENLTSEYETLKGEIQTRITAAQGKNDTTREQALIKLLEQIKVEYQELLPIVGQVKEAFSIQTQAQKEYDEAFKKTADTINTSTKDIAEDVENLGTSSKKVGDEATEAAQGLQRMEDAGKQLSNIQSRIKDLFSVTSVFYTIRRVVRGAIQDFQELDKQFNEIAIVSDYSTKEMWSSFSKVNKVAQEFGVETKNVLEVQNLYYHQGKDMAEVNKLTAQTLTLAKITGMDYERATSDLTAALNAYNIAAEDAVRVTDTIAAMDTNAAISSEELMTALTKTASIAANAGMSLESTEVFLTKMIETTREAPENLGTALKTIIARFGEVKQEIDGEEIELADINRVDTALKSIGISLLDTAGQIRDLDGVFMELSSKWDDLDRNTQRYIATIAAGSRQQSRFIAMMENYDRTLELTEIAQNSAGLGARQLAKSQESIETSVNRLKSTWQEFYSSLITSGMIKGVLELANSVLSLINGLNDISPLLGTIIAALTIWGVKTQIVDKIILKLGQSIGAGIGQTAGFTSVTNIMIAALDKTQKEALLASNAVNEYTKSLIKASLAEENVGNSVLINPNMGKKKAKKLKKKYELGFIDEKGQKTQKYKDFNLLNKERVSKGKKPISMENFDFFNEKNRVKNLFLEKTKGIKLTGKGSIESLKNLKLTDGLKSFSLLLKSGFSSVLIKVGGLFGKLAGAINGVVQFLGGPLTAAILAAVGAFVIWKKFFAASLDDTKKVEKLQKSQEEYNKTLKEYNDLKEKAKIVEKYSDRKNISTEQLQEQQEAVKALVEEYPELLNYIDEEGNYYLKDAKAIQEVIDKKQELLDQEATNYTELRLKYAQEGIYADETTSAGRTMKNIQSYAASLDEDQLKEATKEIDAAWQGVKFSSSNYKKMMKAFGEGKKFSFDEKDMSSLFAGDIGEDNWNEFLKAVKENPIILENEKKMAEALDATGAYLGDNAEKVAEAFIKMNETNGRLFSQLIQGAAEEYSQIEISQAKITIAKGDFAEDLSSEVKEGLSEIALQQAIKEAGGEEKWKDLDYEKKTDYIENATEALVGSFEELSKNNIQGINAAITSANVGGLKFNQATGIDFKADTVEEQKKVLEAFWGQLPKEIQKQLPLDTIRNGSDNVIKTLFKVVSNALEGKDPKDLWKGIYDDFLTSSDMYGKKQNALGLTTAFREEISNLSLDQMQALANATGKMSIEQMYPYLQNVLGAYAGEYRKNGSEKASELFNILTKTDFSSISGIAKVTGELKKFGWTAEQVAQFGVNAMNGIDNIALDNFDTTINDAKSELEGLMSGLEGVTALMEGTASIEQLGSYMNTMMSVWTEAYGVDKAGEMIADLSDDIVATGDGFKIGASAGMDYAESLTNITKEAIITKIALLELKIAEGDLSEEEQANAKATIAYLKQYYSYIDAQQRKTIQDGLIKDLEKAKEKADKLVDSLKALVDWLREYDRYKNLDGVISTLEKDFEHLDFEIKFSTNTDVIEKDLQEQVNNINEQIFANQGGIRAATQEQEMWRDVINKRNSQYVSFDEDGNAIVQAKELEKLQYKISQASEERKPVLQAEYDEIMNNVEAYNKAKDKVEDYNKALEENFKALEDYLKANYEAITKVEDKLIEARQAAEDKELEIIKNKYDTIKDENDKYLESIQEMVDKEREIRDRADRERDVKDKEKKLAMMKMDTSGIYASDIRALEKELEGDYRDLEDDAVDKAIEDLEKEYQTQAEILDKEVEYLESSLDYRREVMTEYNQWAQEMMMQGSDTVLEYLKANDEEYYTGTAAAQANWVLEWNNAVNQGVAANNTMATALDPVMRNLETCKDNANGFEGAVQQYSETALAMNPEVNSSVEELVTQYSNLAEGVSGVETAMDGLAKAYNDAADAAIRLKAAQNGDIYGEGPSDTDIHNKVNEIKENNGNNKGSNGPHKINDMADSPNIAVTKEAYDKPITASDGKKVVRVYSTLGTDMGEIYLPQEAFINNKGEKNKYINHKFGTSYLIAQTMKYPYYKFAKGGYVDYTGPAWLDGTKSHPEYMLNATQTAQFETLVAALNNLYGNGISSLKQSAQKIGDAYYNFHINVEQMANDYDVDQLVSRLEQKMVDSSKYRNITLLKKSQ